MRKFFVLTDIEGAAGVDSFTQTRPGDGFPERYEAAKKLLANEVNACVEGIRSVYPDAHIDVWDGHGPGGLNREDIRDANYLREGQPYKKIAGYDAMLFVGQHAMAGTFHAPLNHTYSSKTVAYYKLNGTFIGEFAARAYIAGVQGVPTVFLSGDDKAALEAKLFVPDIEVAVVKQGLGTEAANHLEAGEACSVIRDGAARAVRRLSEIAPFTAFQAPYEIEIGFLADENPDHIKGTGVEWLNSRTVSIRERDIMSFPFL
ncbi:M55 family metallopeptidase [Paenibacillus sp. MBLB4367]|uniref:M55 family metallopeptidase n=1 Tax=Paenibacillus sp. MBLB4367 TaxID=3384767 RepID=UPI0039082855